MPYQLETISQVYGDREYLAHNFKGATPNDDRATFGMRIPSYGVLDFGSITRNQIKDAVLADLGINSPISLKCIYAFDININTEITLRLLEGNNQLIQLVIPNDKMPYQFPDGLIVDNSLTIRLTASSSVGQLLIYWQPVHLLQYDLIS